MNLKSTYEKADAVLVAALREELTQQGHKLSGALEASIVGEATDEGLKGYALHYQEFINDGFPAASASFKQFPFMIRFFMARGLPEKEAKGAAAATIIKWQKEGMPTGGSTKHSSNGRRQNFISTVGESIGEKLDTIILDGIETQVNKVFHQTKSEKI